MPDAFIPTDNPTNPSEIARQDEDEVEPLRLDHHTVDDHARKAMTKAAVPTLAPRAEGTGEESPLDYGTEDE